MKASEAARPLVLAKTMVVETNHTCNLRCVHCYVPDESKKERSFLDPAFAESLFDQFVALGFGYLLLTGGEPLLHPQFERIYTAASERGLRVTIFTNGLLLDEAKLALLERRPPAMVRVSLFGGDARSYAEVTGQDAFATALASIDALAQRGLPVRAKIPLLRQNASTAASARAMLGSRGISAKVDVRIIPRFNQDHAVLAYRLTPEEIVALELEAPASSLRQYRELRRRPVPAMPTLRRCVERCQPYLVDPAGWLRLCFFLRDHAVDLRDTPLDAAILRLAEDILAQSADAAPSACTGCSRAAFCTYCPGWARNETGRVGEPIAFLCRTTALYQARYEAMLAQGDGDAP